MLRWQEKNKDHKSLKSTWVIINCLTQYLKLDQYSISEVNTNNGSNWLFRFIYLFIFFMKTNILDNLVIKELRPTCGTFYCSKKYIYLSVACS